MAGDVGQRLLNDPVGGPAHRGRHIGPLSLDGQRRLQTGAAGPFHQLGDVVEPTGRCGVVVAQRLKGRAQFASRLTSGFLDRQQGVRHLLAAPTGQVNGNFGLHLDDRDLVGERIMQLTCDVQPFLIGPASRGLLTGALGFVRPPLGLPHSLPCGKGGDQPGQLQDAAGSSERLAHGPVAENQCRQVQSDQHGHGRRHRDGTVPGPHRAVDRDQVRHGEHIETGRLIPHRAQPGDGQDNKRSPAERGQRQSAGRQQRVADQIGSRAGVLSGPPCAQQQRRHSGGDRPVCDTGRDTDPSFDHARTLAG